MSTRRDPELDELAERFRWDEDLRDLADVLRVVPHPSAGVEPTPQFRAALGRRLMREAWELTSRPPLPWYRRLLAPQPMAAVGAAVGALLIVFTVFTFATAPTNHTTTVTVHSSLADAQAVSQVTPIDIKFSQPMDQRSVQEAVQIEPATAIKTYAWHDDTLTITPVHNLAPNTRYQVTVASSAKTANEQQLAKPATVQFVTAPPPPTPTPTPSSSPTSTPAGILGTPHPIAPIGTPAPAWATDGSKLYVVGPGGQLAAWPLQGGTSTPIQPSGVTLAAVGPDGSPAWFAGGQISYRSTTVSGVQPLALGFHQSGLVFATASDVETSDQRRLASFSETATAADISPTGDRVAYLGTSGLHVVDLTSGRDTVVGPANSLGGWSPDGHRYAYPTDASLWIADATAGTTVKAGDLAGVTGVTWSQGNQLLVSTASALYLLNYGDTGGPRKLQDGSFGQPLWAPAGSGYFSFRRAGEVWVAKLQGAVQGTPAPIATGPGQEDVVNGFLLARKNQALDQAMSFLDSAGKDAFGKVNSSNLGASTSLTRYYELLSQPGRVVVRLVIATGNTQMAVDETLQLQADGSGRLWIHGISDAARASFGSGPEIVRVTVGQGQVQVQFDSDLQPGSVASGVSIKGVTTTATYSSQQKVVTLTVPGGLTPGQTYDLLVQPGLQDVSQRLALPYDLQFTGPATGS